MQRLSGLDASFLYLETPSVHMQVALTNVLDPATLDEPYSFRLVRDAIAARLHLVPAFRRRLVEVPFGLHHPVWIDDPDFDLDYHVRRAALPEPGSIEQLAQFSADVISRPLDRRRPLWELWVVEGLEDGHVAVVAKTHHAAVDGVTGAELTGILLDTEPEAEVEPPDEPFQSEPVPGDTEMLARAGIELAAQPLRLARVSARTGSALARLGWRSLRRRVAPAQPNEGEVTDDRVPRKDPPPAPFSAPHAFFNTSITPRRRVAFTSVPLEDLKAIKDAFEVKLNDVVLAVCAGALRAWMLARDELPTDPLVAMVPISVRDEPAGGQGGNRVSAMLTSLATDAADPAERLHRISGGTESGKRQHDAIGATTLTDWTEFAAPAVFSRAARLYSSTRMADRHRPLFNLVISNVPGPQVPLYMRGARSLALYPMGPVIDGGALNITVMSYLGHLYVGLVGCRETVPDLWELAGDIDDEVTTLRKAAPGA